MQLTKPLYLTVCSGFLDSAGNEAQVVVVVVDLVVVLVVIVVVIVFIAVAS